MRIVDFELDLYIAEMAKVVEISSYRLRGAKVLDFLILLPMFFLCYRLSISTISDSLHLNYAFFFFHIAVFANHLPHALDSRTRSSHLQALEPTVILLVTNVLDTLDCLQALCLPRPCDNNSLLK